MVASASGARMAYPYRMTEPPATRDRFRHFLAVPTRWMDNDVYGHVNNVVYYSYFDTVINRYLIDAGGLDIARDAAIGLCVESHCRYLSPLHVFVDRETRKATPIPPPLRDALSALA